MYKRLAIIASITALTLVPIASAGFHAPNAGYWRYCGTGVWAWVGTSHYTSCPFAKNIARGVRSSSDFGSYKLVGTAWSPVTHKTYSVNCTRRAYKTYRCTAGIGAIAWIGG